MEIIISLALCNGFSSPSFLPGSAHISLPVSLAPNRSSDTALEDFLPKNKKTHSAGEWAESLFC
jgi:hypothetical protein